MTLGISRRWEAVATDPDTSPEGADPAASGRGSNNGWRIVAACTLAVALVVGFVGMFFANPAPLSTPYVLPVAMMLALALCARAGRDAPAGVDLAAIFATGVGLRFIGMFFRYRDAVDARVYQRVGEDLAASFRRFDFDVDPERSVPGTGTIRLLSGALNAILFDDPYAVFCAVTLFSIGSMFLFHRAFRIAVPSGDVKRYAVLIALWPALWYWPNSLGKESVMLLGLGLASLGVARLLTHRAALGLAQLAGGLLIAAMVRPHVALIVVVGLVVAVVLRSAGAERRTRAAGRVGLAAVALVAGIALANVTAEHFDVDNLGTTEVGTTLEFAAERTTQGGAGFEPVRVSTPLHYPPALATVLFRPLPFEARSLDSLVASAEGVLLALVIAVSIPRVVAAVRVARVQPYLIYAATYTMLFVYAFSAIGNFGILARQRTQVLPLVLCLLAVTAGSRVVRATSERTKEPSMVSGTSGRRRATVEVDTGQPDTVLPDTVLPDRTGPGQRSALGAGSTPRRSRRS
ncbi:MAG: hypothetical protein JJU45_10365 [Acidimicrobiia bacterium]|nr:hypothetical protein [Acidimicrobiia bacterium]